MFAHTTTPFIIWSVIPAIATLGRITIFCCQHCRFCPISWSSLSKLVNADKLRSSEKAEYVRHSTKKATGHFLTAQTCPTSSRNQPAPQKQQKSIRLTISPFRFEHFQSVNQRGKGDVGFDPVWVSLFNSTFIYLCVSSCFVIPPS